MAKKKTVKKSAPRKVARTMAMARRARLIEEAVELVYDSLQSHLPYTYIKSDAADGGSLSFHKKCVKEYTRILELLAKLY